MGLIIMKVLLLALPLCLSAASAFSSDEEMLLQAFSSNGFENPLNVSLEGLEVSEEDLIEEDVSLEVEEDSAELRRGSVEHRRGWFKKVHKSFKKVINTVGEGIVDAANGVAGVATGVGNSVAGAATGVGNSVANVVIVVANVGNDVVEVADNAVQRVTNEAQSAINEIEDDWKNVKNAAVKVGNFINEDVGKTLKKTLEQVGNVAQDALNEAKKIDNAVMKEINKVKDTISDVSQQQLDVLGSLAVAFADSVEDAFQELQLTLKDAFEAMVKFLSECFDLEKLACYLLLPGCDCEAGSSVSISGSKLKATCVVGLTSEFGKSFGFETGQDHDFLPDSSTGGWNKLAAKDKSPSSKKGKVRDRAEFKTKQLGNKLVRAPSGSCSQSLDFGIDGNLEFEPTIEVELNVLNGKTEVSVEISISMDLNALIEAEGECQFTAQRRFPKKPISKVACYGPACIAILVQAVAEFEVVGTIHGAVFAGLAADFTASSRITIDPATGKADGTLVSSGLGHEEGIKVVAMAGGTMRLGLGPNIIVWPMPGVPMHTTPMIEAEMRMFGTAEFETGILQLNEEASNVSTILQAHRKKLGFSSDVESQSEDDTEAALPGEVVFLQSDQEEDVEQGEEDAESFYGIVEDSTDKEGLLQNKRVLRDEVGGTPRRRRTLPAYASGLVIEKPGGDGICGAFSFNVRGGADLFAFGLPSALADGLSNSFFKDAIKEAVEEIGENLITAVEHSLGKCLASTLSVDLKSLIRKVASLAGSTLVSVVPDISLPGLGNMEILSEQLFCKELYSRDSNGNCQDLSCSSTDDPGPLHLHHSETAQSNYGKLAGTACGFWGFGPTACPNNNNAYIGPNASPYLAGVTRSDVNGCMYLCNANPICGGFEFIGNKCYFRNKLACNLHSNAQKDCYIKKVPQVYNTYNIAADTACEGGGGDVDIGPDSSHTLSAPRNDVSVCMTLCNANPTCDGFSFVAGLNKCFFKQKATFGVKSPIHDCYRKMVSHNYHKAAGTSCGHGGNCGNGNNAHIGPGGSRYVAAARNDVSDCMYLCNANPTCDGFNFAFGKCYFRKDATCNLVSAGGRDCYSKTG